MKSKQSKIKKIEKEIEEYIHKPLAKELLFVVVLLALVGFVVYAFFAGPKLIGFFAAGETNTYVDNINEKFTESQEYNWTVQNFQENSQLVSVKVSGTIQGKGKVYLVTDSGRLLLFDSSNIKTSTSPITAFAAADTNAETSSSSSDESSSGSVDSQDTAQPEPPSSGDSSSPESPSEETDTTSGSGAEIPPEEQLPPAEPPVEEPTGNETSPIDIPPEGNITLPEENVTTPENVTENQTIEIPLAEEVPFENECIDTCYISEILNKSSYILQIEIESEAVLQIDSIYYVLLIPQENITNETVFFATDIVDSDNKTIAAAIEFVDPKTDKIEAIGKSEKETKTKENPIFQAAAVAEEPVGEPGIDIPKGKYNIKVKPQNMPVTEIVFDDIDISQNITEFIKLDDVPENGTTYAEIYAIDPTAFTFTFATVTAVAKGNSLLKCKDWDFANQQCLGDWVFVKSITPGQPYSFTLTPEDPGYAEPMVQSCRAEDDAAKGSFGSACQGTYPAACGAGGDLLSCNDGFVEAHTYRKNSYGGIENITAFNASIVDCIAITNVNLCYEWWRTAGAAALDCDISVSNDSGVTWTAMTTTCPGTTANPGITCTNVTGLKTWSCTHFLDGGAVRAKVKSELTRVTSGGATTETASWDVMYFQVNYTTDAIPPQWSNPQKNATTVYKNDYVLFNTSWTDNKALSAYIFSTNNTASWANQSAVAFSGTANTSNQIYQITANRNTVVGWRFYANDTSNLWNATDIQTFTVGDRAPNSTLNSPADGNVSTTTSITFNCSAADDYNLTNVTLYGNFSGTWQSNGTNTVTGTSNTTTFARTLAQGYYVWNCLARDDVNQAAFAAANRTLVISVDTVAPTVTPNNPVNNAVDGDGSIVFNCSAADAGTGLANISLYINSVLNQTNTVTGSSNSTTFSKTLANGNYNWYCRAFDVVGNANNSATYALTVNTTAVPISTNYTGNTTNWGALPDLTNVCNGQAILDKPANGQIQWYGCVNAASQNFDSYVTISDNFIAVNFGLNPSFNSSAHLIIRNLTWEAQPEILMDGILCSPSVCQNITYDNISKLEFDVTHFTNFTTVGNSQLVIWDQNDTGMPGGNLPACMDSQIKFFANYSRSSNGNPITSATCIINFTDTTNNAMTYNGTSLFYEYNRTFSTPGSKSYIVRCSRTGFQTLTLSDSVNITDCAAPTTALVSPPNGNITTKDVNFTCNATDNYQLSNITLYWNYTGTFSADGTNAVTGTSNQTTFQKTNLNEGAILWNCLACDNSSNCAFAPANWTVTVDATPPVVNLMSPANNTTIATQTQNFIFNATDNHFSTLSCTLYINDVASGTNNSVVNNTATTITNTTIPEGNDLWHVNCTDGAANIGKSNVRLLTVDATPPVITHIRPVQNDILGYTVTLEVNATDNVVGVSSVWYQITNTSGIVKSGTMSGTAPVYTDTWNTITVGEYNYTFTAYANDTLGNQINSSVNFTIDNTPALIQIFTPLNNSQWNSNFNLNVSIQNQLLAASSYNITNSTGYVVQSNSNNSINQSTYNWTDLVNVNSLSSGAYNLTIYARNNVGYPAYESVLFIIDKLAPQYSNLSASPTSPTIYSPTQTYEFNATWIDNLAVSTVIFEFNGTNYTDAVQSGNVYSKTFAGLPAGSYNYKWYANDTAGNWNSTGTFTYTINKMPTTTQLYIDGAQANKTITYGTQSNATAITSVGSVILYRDGNNVSNPEIATLGVGIYNYTAVNTGDSNYLPSSETWFLTVNKASDVVRLYLNGNESNLTITYGNQSNATTTSLSGTHQLFRNDSPVSNPEIAILAAGTYQYKANSTGNANYSANFGITYYLNITKAIANITLLLNGTDGDFNVNRSQTVNITGIRNAGEGNMQLYDNGTLINTGAPVITNLTSYATIGQRNITLYLNETQNYTAAIASTHLLNVYGILSAYVTIPTGTPKYYEGQNITFKGYVYDDLASPVDSATVTFEPINGSFVYVCSSSLGEGSGIYNCTLDTTGMAAPRIYDVRINATKAYYHLGTYTNSSIFLLESGQKANLLLHKIPSVLTINSSHITYNISLHLANGRGTSENTILTDPDAGQTWNESTIFGAQEIIESYLLTYNRGSVDNLITLQKANVTGYDPAYNMSLFTESNQPVIVIPQNITAAQLTLIKNLVFVNQTTTNITYMIVDTIVNSGGEDLTNIAIVDSDISLTTTANLTRGASVSYSANKTIAKSSQSYAFNFTQTSAFANSQFFYSNQPSIIIPGYGGPYDVIIDSLPASVTAGSTITGVVKAINMNSEISEDRTLTTWIEDAFGNITALDIRTIFVGRNQSATASVTLTAPLTPGTYYFVSKLTWPTADANASKAFTVTSAVTPPVTPPSAPPVMIPPVNITLPPGVPQDIIDSLIELRNLYNELNLKVGDLDNILKAAEDAAARGNYELARNLLKSAYGMYQEIQLEVCGKTNIIASRLGITLPTVQFKLPSVSVRGIMFTLLAALTVIFITALIVKRRGDMAIEAELLREERTHLEKLYDKVSNYLNRKITKGDKG